MAAIEAAVPVVAVEEMDIPPKATLDVVAMSWGRERVTAPVDAEAVTWLAVPVIEVTPVFVMVTPPVPLPTVVMPFPWMNVAVPPWLIVELEPEDPARVQRLPPDTRQVEQPMSPRAERVTGLVAETATVPVALGKVQVWAAVRSVEVIVPVKEAVAVVDWGFIAIESLLAVVEPKTAEPVPFKVWLMPILLSVPVAVQVGLDEAAALAKVK